MCGGSGSAGAGGRGWFSMKRLLLPSDSGLAGMTVSEHETVCAFEEMLKVPVRKMA